MSRCSSKQNAAKRCVTKHYDRQPFPQTGLLADNMNWQLGPLRKKIGQSQAIVYCYVIATIENQHGHFVQRGSGPNFQGDLITLCTCKHYMRTFMDAGDWKGKWVAGFTGVKAGEGKNFLVYLMQVSHAFKSHYDFWNNTGIISDETKQVKATHSNNFGDIYEPRRETKKFDPQSYISPRKSHVHFPDYHWHKDIDYIGCSERRAALLVGDVKSSFLWDKPMIFYTHPNLPRGQKKFELADLSKRLKTGPRL